MGDLAQYFGTFPATALAAQYFLLGRWFGLFRGLLAVTDNFDAGKLARAQGFFFAVALFVKF